MTDTPDPVLTNLRERERELVHERDILDGRLGEVRDLIELIEKPARRPRAPRTVRLDEQVSLIQPPLHRPPDDAA
jgi:hypothetical protein